jgi:general stress protein 26
MNNTNHLAELVESLGQTTGVLSTLGEDGGVDSAVVYFTIDRNLNLYFFTRSNSKKFQNIGNNSNVSFVAYSERLMQTFQMRGDASIIDDPVEQRNAFEEMLKIARKSSSHPPITQMMESEIMVLKVIPLWARFSNFDTSKEDEKIVELHSNEVSGDEV